MKKKKKNVIPAGAVSVGGSMNNMALFNQAETMEKSRSF